jgi:hypothetical protein
MTQLAGTARPPSLRAVVRGIADRRHVTRAHDAPADRRTPVGGQLERLGPRWRVVDGVAAGRRGHIDHLVIGPGGVFVITGVFDARRTVCLAGDSLLIDGSRVHHVRDSREDIADVQRRLTQALDRPVTAMALVMIYGDRRFAVPPQSDDAMVRIATAYAGVRWMRRRPVAWDAFDVERLHAAALAPATWSPIAAR